LIVRHRVDLDTDVLVAALPQVGRAPQEIGKSSEIAAR
jgi:hypothetical protein